MQTTEDLDEIIDGMYINICNMYMYLRSKEKKRSKRLRRWRTKPLNSDKDSAGFYKKFLELKETEDGEELFQNIRMSRQLFDSLLELTHNFLTKQKQQILAEERLAITLGYLASGDSVRTLAYRYKIGAATVRQIVSETCDVIVKVLWPIYVKMPDAMQYTKIAEQFRSKWDMPNCVGALDRRMSNVKILSNATPAVNALVLMAACDTNYVFTHVSIDKYDETSDLSSLDNSDFGQALINRSLDLPPDTTLPNRSSIQAFPYYFVADSSFPLKPNIMRPYTDSKTDRSHLVFNYRLSRARSTIDNAFGLLIARWHILGKFIECSDGMAEKIISACFALHNFILLNDTRKQYCPLEFVDRDINGDVQPGQWRSQKNVGGMKSVSTRYRNTTIAASILRNSLATYLCGPGAVPFQDSKILIHKSS